MRTNYVLIDYENVQPATLTALDHPQVKILLFMGPHQSKIAADTAIALHKMGPRAEYIQMTTHGANALDFHIAFYIGQIVAQDPNSYVHIISKDTGFDPLIQHLRGKKICVSRAATVQDISFFKAVQSTSLVERLAVIVANLHQSGAARPRSVKTLSNSINVLFQKTLSEAELETIIRELQVRRVIAVNDTKVTYTLPDSAQSKAVAQTAKGGSPPKA